MQILKFLFLLVCGASGSWSAQAAQGEIIASTGAVFVVDDSHPAFQGATYRDPSGMLWSSPILQEDGSPKLYHQFEAYWYCSSLEARLPTREDFERLAKYLGQDSLGYIPSLPGITEQVLWSSTSQYVNSVDSAIVFAGPIGTTQFVARVYQEAAVSCVAQAAAN